MLEHMNIRHCIIVVENKVFTISPPNLKALGVDSCHIEGDIIISSTTLSRINYKGDLGVIVQELNDVINGYL